MIIYDISDNFTGLFISRQGRKNYFKNGELHRLDGPALESRDGKHQEWWVNGKLHREDGPAIIGGAFGESWYLNDISYNKETFDNIFEVARQIATKNTSLGKEILGNSTFKLGE